MHRSSLGILALLSIAPSALAQATDPLQPRAQIRLSAEPSLWYVAPSGDIRFPGSGGVVSDIILADDINMDSPRLSPFLELNIDGDRWSGSFRAVTLAAHSRGSTSTAPRQMGDTLVGAGSSLSTSLDYLQIEAEVRYALYPFWQDQPETRDTKPWKTFDHRFELVGGLRLIDFSLATSQISSGTVTPVAEADATFILPYVGIKGTAVIHEKLTIDLMTNFGGGPTLDDAMGFSWDIMVGFQYHVTPHLGAQIGYRQTLFRLEQEDTQLEWNGAVAGLFFGFVGRF